MTGGRNITLSFADIECVRNCLIQVRWIADNTEAYYIADGNKNIIALKDSSGADVSTYAYTPFGSLENPVDGDENPFRFSSEYADDETGLVYYNYRYYSPQLGRWTKRDPIEEQGGVNLYVMCINATTLSYDKRGTSLGGKLLLGYALNAINGLLSFGQYKGSDHYVNYKDSNNELVQKNFKRAIERELISYIKTELTLTQNWQRFAMPRKEITPFGLSAESLAGYLLNEPSGGIFINAYFSAKCKNKIIFTRYVIVNYEWYDNIDANSFEETYNRYYRGRPFDHLKDFPHILENIYDLIAEKTFVPDCYVRIYGTYKRNEEKQIRL